MSSTHSHISSQETSLTPEPRKPPHNRHTQPSRSHPANPSPKLALISYKPYHFPPSPLPHRCPPCRQISRPIHTDTSHATALSRHNAHQHPLPPTRASTQSCARAKCSATYFRLGRRRGRRIARTRRQRQRGLGDGSGAQAEEWARCTGVVLLASRTEIC